MAHEKVADEVALRVKNRVLDGMGFIALHSAPTPASRSSC